MSIIKNKYTIVISFIDFTYNNSIRIRVNDKSSIFAILYLYYTNEWTDDVKVHTCDGFDVTNEIELAYEEWRVKHERNY